MTEYYDEDSGNRTNTSPKKEQKEWERQVVEIIGEEWEKGRQYCDDLNELYEDIYEMFRGGRPNKQYDWQSNITLRKAFQVAWTTVTYAIKKIYGGSPIVGVKGFDQIGCWQREILLEKWGEKDKALVFHIMAWLRLVLNGVVFIKKTWKQELRQGPGMMVPVEDHPHNVVLNNKDVVVDWQLTPGQSCRDGRFIIHQEIVDLSTIFGSKVNYVNLDKLNVEDMGSKSQYEQNHSDEKQRDGQGDTPESPFYKETVVRERQGTFAVMEKDGELIPSFDPEEIYAEDSKYEFVEMVATVADPDGQAALIRWEKNPYGEKTIFDGHLYMDIERWHSMGQIEPSMELMGAIDDNVNAMFDEIWKNLFPPTIANKFAMIEWDTIQHSPQAVWQVGGNPNEHFMFQRPSNITTDAWQKHAFLDGEQQLTTSVTQNLQGAGKEKTATQGVLNAQYSSDKMDFLVMLYEHFVMKTDAKLNIRFAQKFGHPITFIAMLGRPFKFDRGWKEEYEFIPCASSVKLEQQKEVEIQQDIQLIQILQGMNNPKTAAVMNVLLGNILRNRDMPVESAQFDENYFEPQGDAGTAQLLNNMAGSESNQNGVPMSSPERSVRGQTFKPRGLLN